MAPARIAAELQHDIDGRPHIGEDILALERRATFEHQQRQLLERAFDTIGVDRRHRSRMPRVDRAQEGKSFGSAQFAQNYAVRPHAQRSRYQVRSEEHTSELQSLMRISYAVFCLQKKKNTKK